MSVLNIIFLVFFVLINNFVLNLYFLKIFKIYQLKQYFFIQVFKNFKVTICDVFLIINCLIFNILIFFSRQNFYILSSILLVFYLLNLLFVLKFKQKNQKNRLVFTKRFMRFFVLYNLFSLSFFSLSVFLLIKNLVFAFFFVNFLILGYLIFIFTHLCIFPIEKLIKQFYIKKAKKKLKAMKNLIVVGITGSFAKTSVKNFLYEMLKSKFKVCKSQKSFNTDMGITKVVLNDLKFDDEILILEYGADRNHDIKKLCKIVSPNYSIITGVNSQHLNTFKRLENIINTKYELVENTKNDGVVVFNGDNEITKQFYDKTNNLKKFKVGLNLENDLFAENIVTTISGTFFNVNINNKKYFLHTKLFGKHNVLNLLLAIKMTLVLGVEIEDIIKSIERIEQVPHRLNLIINEDKYILDDSFNANIDGVKSALEVLKIFPNKKYVITGGLVELGKKSYEENVKLGKMLASFDGVVITNKTNQKALLDGLKNSKNVYVADSLNEAVKKLNEFFSAYDCVLFLNDLPDCYG